MRRCICPVLLAACLAISPVSAPKAALSCSTAVDQTPRDDGAFVYYRDSKYAFLARYPKTWKAVPISGSIMRLSVESADHVDAFTINVIGSLGVKPPSPKEFLDEALKRDYAAIARANYPDITVLERGPTSISDQDAFYWIFKATFVRGGTATLSTMIQIQTTRDGNIYTLSCATASERFDIELPLFKDILAGFTLPPEAATGKTPSDSVLAEGRSTIKTARGIEFRPEGSDFYVIFPMQPDVKTVEAMPVGGRFRYFKAELAIRTENCFLRAEFVPGPPLLFLETTDDSILDGLRRYAEDNGLQDAEASVNKGPLGKYGKLRGYKTIDGVMYTFEGEMYYGTKSIMVMLAGGPSRTFPQRSVARFFASMGK